MISLTHSCSGACRCFSLRFYWCFSLYVSPGAMVIRNLRIKMSYLKTIIAMLLFLDAEDQTMDIRLFINSPGGSVTAGMGIYDAMKMCKADVSTICFGLAASMGAFLLASGTKGKRFFMPNSRVMIHQPLGTSGGKAKFGRLKDHEARRYF